MNRCHIFDTGFIFITTLPFHPFSLLEVDDVVKKSSIVGSSCEEQVVEESVDYKPRLCVSCGQPIVDRYMSKIFEQFWHEACLKCCTCGVQLANACFNKDGNLYCKDDYCL